MRAGYLWKAPVDTWIVKTGISRKGEMGKSWQNTRSVKTDPGPAFAGLSRLFSCSCFIPKIWYTDGIHGTRCRSGRDFPAPAFVPTCSPSTACCLPSHTLVYDSLIENCCSSWNFIFVAHMYGYDLSISFALSIIQPLLASLPFTWLVVVHVCPSEMETTWKRHFQIY